MTQAGIWMVGGAGARLVDINHQPSPILVILYINEHGTHDQLYVDVGFSDPSDPNHTCHSTVCRFLSFFTRCILLFLLFFFK